jgi:large subunit ribosomal protein L6
MSRIGKQPIDIPAGVEVSVAGSTVTVKGARGTLRETMPEGIAARVEEKKVLVERQRNDKRSRSLHGLARALIRNHVRGVTEGYRIELEIHGVSYQASATPKVITLKVGYANAIPLTIPEGVVLEVPNPTHVVVTGADKQKVGEFAAKIRQQRPPEPYKGKGIRYRGEQIQRKAGKSFVGSE